MREHPTISRLLIGVSGALMLVFVAMLAAGFGGFGLNATVTLVGGLVTAGLLIYWVMRSANDGHQVAVGMALIGIVLTVIGIQDIPHAGEVAAGLAILVGLLSPWKWWEKILLRDLGKRR